MTQAYDARSTQCRSVGRVVGLLNGSQQTPQHESQNMGSAEKDQYGSGSRQNM